LRSSREERRGPRGAPSCLKGGAPRGEPCALAPGGILAPGNAGAGRADADVGGAAPSSATAAGGHGRQQPALFAWVTAGGKNLTPVRRCCLGGPHPRTSVGWRRFCQRLGHGGVTKHAEMAAIAAINPDVFLRGTPRRRLTLVVVRVRRAQSDAASEVATPFSAGSGSSSDAALHDVEAGVGSEGIIAAAHHCGLLGCARPCDECAKVIVALGCFRRVVYSQQDGSLVSVAPEDLIQSCTPSSAKRRELRRLGRAGDAADTRSLVAPEVVTAPPRRRRRRLQPARFMSRLASR